jgi:hypothetical protein
VAESYVQVAPDSTGKKLRTNETTIGANVVHEQYVMAAGFPTYYYLSGLHTAVGSATAHFIDVFNASGSGTIIKIRKLFIQQSFVVQTGTGAQIDIFRTSTVCTGGTVITPVKADTSDATLHANVTARSLPTGGGTSVGPFCTLQLSGEETDVGSRAAWGINVLAEGNETKDFTLREGEGIRVTKTSGVVTTSGSFSALIIATTV